jgi:hypothetical protein
MSTVSPAKQAQHVVDGHTAAIAFMTAMRTSSPTGDELTAIVQTHSHPLAEESRLFLKGFLRQLQKTLEHAAARQKGISL